MIKVKKKMNESKNYHQDFKLEIELKNYEFMPI